MVNLNVRPSSYVKPLAALAPASITAATSFAAFVDTQQYLKVFLVVVTTTQAGADVEMLQSDAANGSSPAALPLVDGAKKVIADADDNKVFVIDVTDPTKRYVDVKITPSAAGIIGAYLFGIPRNETAPVPSTV